MKILVINLDRRPERLHRMDSLLSDLHLPFERVTAVDGQGLNDDLLNRWVQGPGRHGRLSTGETACFLSHRKCWEIAARGKAGEYVVVLEDDILLGKRATAVLSSTEWIPADADIVKLETNLRWTSVDRTPTRSASGRRIVRLRNEHINAAGYIVSPKAATKLLRMSETFRDPVDHFLFDPLSVAFHAMVIYQLSPAICIQGSVASQLPANVFQSALEEERRQSRESTNRRPRRTGAAKLKRELKRPIEQAAILLRCWAAHQKPGHIPFE